jgi:uncharacterized protein
MVERRFSTSPIRVERRADGDSESVVVVGHASVFDQWTTLYEGRYFTWREIVRPGAFARAIRDGQDVRALWNHDANIVLGRTRSGTLVLREDEQGLLSEINPPPTQTVRDLVLSPIDRGDVSGMSFAFDVPNSGERRISEKPDGSTVVETGFERITLRTDGERRIEERELLNVDIFDVSPVTYPAYDGTDVTRRAAMFGGDSFARRIAEMDRPHRRHAPQRDAVRKWLKNQ